jgi:cytochrome bd ubiquinol oxidase subunit II
METLWFILLGGMLVGYALLDGIDFGVAVLFPCIARNEDERLAVRATIGHLWHAYEVWLIAFGGLLFLAFPRAYAGGFSGFYLAFMALLWCFIGRGLALEVRSHLDQPVWREACDILLPIASLLIAAFLGAALGNVLRGVAIDHEGRLFLPLWTNLLVGGNPAIFDWYTIVMALTCAAVFLLHGANYLAMKTADPLRQRAVRLAWRLHAVSAVLTTAAFALTPWVNRRLLDNFLAHPGTFALVGATAVALAAGFLFRYRRQYAAAFAASSAFILLAMVCAAFALYPNLLPSIPDPDCSLTIHNSAASTYSLTVGLAWFAIGITIAVLCQAYKEYLFAATLPGTVVFSY